MRRALVAAVLSFAACQAGAGGGGPEPPVTTIETPAGPVKLRVKRRYPDGPDGLRALWLDIVSAARKDEREDVHDLMSSLIMSDSDLDELFGAARAKDLAPRYAPMIRRLANIGAMELVAQILEKRYDDAQVFAFRSDGTPQERAVLASLPPGTPVWGVRVGHKDKPQGERLRYDFFVYRHGRWVTGNLLAKYLLPAAVDGGAG